MPQDDSSLRFRGGGRPVVRTIIDDDDRVNIPQWPDDFANSLSFVPGRNEHRDGCIMHA
jgi:hypothetical protein